MKRIVIVGGGYAGFYTAWGLEKRLRRREASVIVIDPAPYMTYQPFLPEVAAGSIEPRHAVIPLRRHLRRTRIVSGRATKIDHAVRIVHVQLADGTTTAMAYDEVVVTAGVVTRVFPVPGVADEAIGMKRIEEAVAIRDAVTDQAASLPPGAERHDPDSHLHRGRVRRGGGLRRGVEPRPVTHPLPPRDLGRGARLPPGRRKRPDPSRGDAPRRRVGAPAPRAARRDRAPEHVGDLGGDGRVQLSTGEVFESGLVVWTAGIAANPVIARHTDLPINERGLVVVRPDLRVGTPEQPVEHAWAAGDDAAVPDLAAGPGVYTVPNAQHAVRQGKRLAKNVVAALRGREPTAVPPPQPGHDRHPRAGREFSSPGRSQ